MKKDQLKFTKIKVKTNQYILILVFFTLIGILLIWEFNKQIKEKVGQYNKKKEEITILEQRISNLNRLENEYKSISSDIEMIENILPKEDKLVDIVSNIESLAENNKLEISAKFDEEPSSHKLKASFIIKGYFSDVMNFYKELMQDKVLVSINSISMTNSDNLLDNAEVVFGMEVYFD